MFIHNTSYFFVVFYLFLWFRSFRTIKDSLWFFDHNFSLIMVQDLIFTPSTTHCGHKTVRISSSCQIRLNGVRRFTDSVTESMNVRRANEKMIHLFKSFPCWMWEKRISLIREWFTESHKQSNTEPLCKRGMNLSHDRKIHRFRNSLCGFQVMILKIQKICWFKHCPAEWEKIWFKSFQKWLTHWMTKAGSQSWPNDSLIQAFNC